MSILNKLVFIFKIPLFLLRPINRLIMERVFGFHEHMSNEERQKAQARTTWILALGIPLLVFLISSFMPNMQTNFLSQAGKKQDLPQAPANIQFTQSGGSFKVKDRPLPKAKSKADQAGGEKKGEGKTSAPSQAQGNADQAGGEKKGEGKPPASDQSAGTGKPGKDKTDQNKGEEQAKAQTGKPTSPAGKGGKPAADQPQAEEVPAKPLEPIKRPGDQFGPFLPTIAFRKIETFYGQNSPERGVRVYLENNGDQTLVEAVVQVALLDEHGKPLLEKKIMPLVVSGGIYGDRILPLAPGLRHPFFLGSRDIPDTWAGETRVRLLSFRFAPTPPPQPLAAKDAS